MENYLFVSLPYLVTSIATIFLDSKALYMVESDGTASPIEMISKERYS